MLTKVTAYSPLADVPALVMNLANIADADLVEIRNLDGLDSVKASVNTTPYGSSKGESYGGSSVGKRNLVFTLGLRPDWDTWTFTKIRRFLDSYFMPEMNVTLIFEGTEQAPVVISGYVESNEASIFSKDPEQVVSIICPEPDFVAVDPQTVTGLTTDSSIHLPYLGTVETGFMIHMVEHTADYNVSDIAIHKDAIEFEISIPSTDSPNIFADSDTAVDINSMVRQKKVSRSNQPIGDTLSSLMGYITDASVWPVIGPGGRSFQITSDRGVQTWTVTYFERFGSL